MSHALSASSSGVSFDNAACRCVSVEEGILWGCEEEKVRARVGTGVAMARVRWDPICLASMQHEQVNQPYELAMGEGEQRERRRLAWI